jgi:tripartite-type tricarboxylate transporter receptor subunit TctC
MGGNGVRMRALACAICFALGGLVGTSAWAATGASTYPERPVRVVVPFPAGGGTDALARIFVRYLAEGLGKNIVVDNRGGAGGNIGIAAVARATPDGYTLLITSGIFVVNPSLYKPPPFDPFNDFIPIAWITATPNVIVTRADSQIKSVADLIAIARSKPDYLNYASSGSGTTSHLAMELLKLRAQVNITHIPYSGAAPALQSILSGATHLATFGMGGAVVTYIGNGTLRGLVHTRPGRLPEFPNIPNMTEAGFPNSDSENFNMLMAPAGTPEAIIARLEKESLAVMSRPEVLELMRKGGYGIVGKGAEAARAHVAREVRMWKEVIQKASVKAE